MVEGPVVFGAQAGITAIDKGIMPELLQDFAFQGL